MSEPELHLFVVWPKGRFAEARILADLARETEIVWKGDLRFAGDMACSYQRFYGPQLPDARRKVANCGKGPFLVVVVRDTAPRYEVVDTGGFVKVRCNVRMLELKNRYREWAGRRHRVHGTVSPVEFARNVRMLTGRTSDEWASGVPVGEMAPDLPDGWLAASTLDPFERGRAFPQWGADWGNGSGALEDGVRFLENKYINDVFHTGRWRGVDAIEKHTRKAVWSIGNEYRISARVYDAAPGSVPRPLAWRFAADGSWASLVAERVKGPSLADLLAWGISGGEADVFAGDILRLADALEKTGIVHRDLFADNFLRGEDGHLKAIDWQLAIDRNHYQEDPWVKRNWKFRYIVFGVNRELGLGVWNDFHAMGKLLAEFPQTPAVRSARESLAARARGASFSAPPDRWTRLRLWIYGCSLRIQLLFHTRKYRKYAQLERRWRTVTCRWPAEENKNGAICTGDA